MFYTLLARCIISRISPTPQVEYWSETLNRWVEATVLRVNKDSVDLKWVRGNLEGEKRAAALDRSAGTRFES